MKSVKGENSRLRVEVGVVLCINFSNGAEGDPEERSYSHWLSRGARRARRSRPSSEGGR